MGGSAAKPWIDLDRDMPFPVKAGWRAAVHRESPSMQNCGVEKLTIEFK